MKNVRVKVGRIQLDINTLMQTTQDIQSAEAGLTPAVNVSPMYL